MNFTSEDLVQGLVWYLVFLFSTVLHEFGHAITAFKLGDDTAYQNGQVGLDPLPHIRQEPVGMLLVPFLSFFSSGGMIGWASTPYDPYWAIRYPRRAAWMALAGPAANLVLVLLAVLLFHTSLKFDDFLTAHLSETLLQSIRGFFVIVFSLNLLLLALNLVPLPPFDGSKILMLFLKEGTAVRYMNQIANPYFSLLGMIFMLAVFPRIFKSLFGMVLHWVF